MQSGMRAKKWVLPIAVDLAEPENESAPKNLLNNDWPDAKEKNTTKKTL